MKPNWKKIAIILSDTALAAYLVMAFTSFNEPDTSDIVCRKVNIGIDDGEKNGFINAKEIKKRLEAAAIYPIGKQIDDINARGIEEKLKTSPFVKTAECYKTQGGQVFINITQRLPVIRIKAENGDDYYIDDKNSIMPNSTYTSDLIIATGHISKPFATRYISPMGKTLMANDFWRNLVEQIHVLPDNAIEIVPRIGDHIVYMGRLPESNSPSGREEAISEFVTTKMTRLEKFYRYGLSHAGWNKYAVINIEFDNQIICKKHSGSGTAAYEPTEPADTTAKKRPDEASAASPSVSQQAANASNGQKKKTS